MNLKPIKMFNKLREFNNNINAWWLKQQGKLTKRQHIILTVVCLLYFIIATGFSEEGGEKTIFNYYLPLLCFVTIGGSFSGNAIYYDKYKKKE